MKKWLISCLVLSVVIVLGFGIYYVVPKTVNQSLKGVEYQLGYERYQSTPVTISIKGKVHYTLLGKRIFIGTININGARYSNLDEGTQLEISFDRNGTGVIGQPNTRNYGLLYANKDFSKVTMPELRKDKDGNSELWTPGDGWMVTGPANDRSKALEISNELMKKVNFRKLK